jgi:RHS repeat-associated protein
MARAQRLSQVKHNNDGTAEDGFYGYHAHTDVETLTDKNGDTKATYGYTAYGSNETSEFTGIDKPDATDPTKEAYNPYRYNAKRWDAQSGTYDMGFRDYSPGLNRFTSRDMYTGALADMKLGADPFTGNRYAFTGGNPISRIELDGHIAIPVVGADVAAAALVAVAAGTTDTDQLADSVTGVAEEGGRRIERTAGMAKYLGSKVVDLFRGEKPERSRREVTNREDAPTPPAATVALWGQGRMETALSERLVRL